MSVPVMIGSLGDAVPSIDKNAWVAPGVVVVGAVHIGRFASVWYGSVLRADEDEIVVGAGCNIQDLCWRSGSLSDITRRCTAHTWRPGP